MSDYLDLMFALLAGVLLGVFFSLDSGGQYADLVRVSMLLFCFCLACYLEPVWSFWDFTGLWEKAGNN